MPDSAEFIHLQNQKALSGLGEMEPSDRIFRHYRLMAETGLQGASNPVKTADIIAAYIKHVIETKDLDQLKMLTKGINTDELRLKIDDNFHNALGACAYTDFEAGARQLMSHGANPGYRYTLDGQVRDYARAAYPDWNVTHKVDPKKFGLDPDLMARLTDIDCMQHSPSADPLFVAAGESPAVLRAMLKKMPDSKAAANARDRNGTALAHAALEGKKPESLCILRDAGADLDAPYTILTGGFGKPKKKTPTTLQRETQACIDELEQRRQKLLPELLISRKNRHSAPQQTSEQRLEELAVYGACEVDRAIYAEIAEVIGKDKWGDRVKSGSGKRERL